MTKRMQDIVLERIVDRLELACGGPAAVNFGWANEGHVFGMSEDLSTVVDVKFNFQTDYATFDVEVVDGPTTGAGFHDYVAFSRPDAVPGFFAKLDAATAGA